jgi:hypothetical protein
VIVTIRCVLDGLMLPAVVRSAQVPPLVAFEGDESFPVEAVEALFYEVVSATREEVLALERAHYRLLRPAEDFQLVAR